MPLAANTEGRFSTLTSGNYTSRSSSNQMHALPVKFHLNSLFFTNILNPSLYLTLEIFVSASLLQIAHHIQKDNFLDGL